MFRMDKQRLKLCNVNCKPEIHGEEHVTATYLTLEAKVSNTVFDQFDPKLRPSLFQKAADNTQEELIDGHLPELKFPMLGPLTYGWEGAGYKSTIEYGATGNDIVLPMSNLDNFRFELADGGTVTMKFRIVCKTDALNNGRLIDMQQQEITLSLEPPSAEEQLKQQQDAEKAGGGKSSGDDNTGDLNLEGDGADPLYEQAKKLVADSGKASISFVQKELRIGYNRAARLIEEMEKAGVVSAMDAEGKRTVLEQVEEAT
jgi:hypothetical protein